MTPSSVTPISKASNFSFFVANSNGNKYLSISKKNIEVDKIEIHGGANFGYKIDIFTPTGSILPNLRIEKLVSADEWPEDDNKTIMFMPDQSLFNLRLYHMTDDDYLIIGTDDIRDNATKRQVSDVIYHIKQSTGALNTKILVRLRLEEELLVLDVLSDVAVTAGPTTVNYKTLSAIKYTVE